MGYAENGVNRRRDLRGMIKEFVDVLRIGDRLDKIWDDSQGAWKDINDGNLSDAGKKLLSVGGNSFIEIMRIADLALIGGGIKSLTEGAAKVITDLVEVALREQDPRTVLRFIKGADEAVGVATKITKSQAQKYLKSEGITDDTIAGFINSFDGDITARIIEPGEAFFRYTDDAGSTGSFLTKADHFTSTQEAVDALAIGEFSNNATLRQTVVANKRTIVLEGKIKGSSQNLNQSVLVELENFIFLEGENYI